MVRLFSITCVALAICGLLDAPVFAERKSSLAVSDDAILSVLIHREWIYASTAAGVYRASPRERKWVALAMPDRVPRAGLLAKEESAACSIYYMAPFGTRSTVSPAAGKQFGLYRFDPLGDRWDILDSEHDFSGVYVCDDWLLYALGYNNGAPMVVWMSKDSGRRWKSISKHVPSNICPHSMFSDPDHRNLICLEAYGDRRGKYVLQASDDEFHWELENYSDWLDRYHPTEGFFVQCCGGTEHHRFFATLSNYFAHPFGNQTEIPAFEIRVSKKTTVKEGERVVVPIEVAFRQESGAKVTLLDTEHGREFWGLKGLRTIALRDIGRKTVVAQYGGAFHGIMRDGIPKPTRPRTESLRLHQLVNGQSYNRSLDLSEFYDFSEPGTYRLQLEYFNCQIADASKGEWQGEFTSPVFEVVVEPKSGF